MKKINYNPKLSVADNADNNGVEDSTIWYYLRSNNISRRAYNTKRIHKAVRKCALENPGMSAGQIAKKLNITIHTARKYMNLEEAPVRKSYKCKNKSEINAFLSVSDSQQRILDSIIAIHLDPDKSTFDCDLTAGECGFYQSIPRPAALFDLNPISKLNVNPLEDTDGMSEVYDSVVVDLPVTICSEGKEVDAMTQFRNKDEMEMAHKEMLDRAFRLLKSGGILVYKTRDFIYEKANRWTSEFVLFEARERHFNLKDKFIYIEPKKNLRRRARVPAAAILAHAYFFVFKKP